ncbi:MAG: hypothetical protein KJ000_11750 [Pirellulaceae bacterium]|nr:hypothetical protein [Pirellulaceae bacterium]
MAARESQGLQVALILFVMITVVLAVTTYLYFRKAEEKIQLADAARAEAKRATDMYNTADFKNQIYRHVLGYETKAQDQLTSMLQALAGTDREDMDATLKNFDQEMKLYGVGFAGQALNYRTLPSHLVAIVNEKNSKLADADQRQDELVKEREQVRQAEAARAVKAETELASVRAELQQERAKFNDDRTRVVQAKDVLAAQLPLKDQQLAAVSSEAAQRIEALTKERDQVRVLLDAAREQLAKQKETTYETADGQITWVNQGSRTVWINLGSADGLQRQMTFSVYDKDQSGVTTAPIKGRIEVTRILEPHLAEARILEDSLSNPILQDDKIYSPSFRKGQQTHFALAGLLDINRDGRSDQEKVKSIININNGVIDCELKEDGTIEGKMTSSTKYLVRGTPPTDKSNEKLTKGYSEMIGEATRLGIETITLETLMDRMGYFDDARVVPMQRGGGALTPDEGADGGGFRKRQPGSAY